MSENRTLRKYSAPKRDNSRIYDEVGYSTIVLFLT
jgi:hypothetical protein